MKSEKTMNTLPETDKIISFIFNPDFSGWLILAKILFIVAALVFVIFMIIALFKTYWLRRLILWDFQEIVTYRPYGVRKVEKDWLKIKSRLDTGLESEYKLAIIEADSMLDIVLSKMGFGGESLGERLEKITEISLPNLGEVKIAHGLRNNIVHDPDYKLSLDETKKTISTIEKSLTDLQAL